MIWNLLLAHLLADFPLQPMWLVRSKERTWGLAVHGSVHFLTTLLLVGSARLNLWPQVLALAVFHFLVDVVKYRLGISRPLWAVVSYFVDQAVHLLSLVVVAGWIESVAPGSEGLVTPAIAIYACGYLIATHVWYVTEKTISQQQPAYRDELETTLWPRMLVRAGLLSALLYVVSLALPAAGSASIAARIKLSGAGSRPPAHRLGQSAAGLWPPAAATLQLPYRKDRQWRRALLTDLLVTAIATAFIRIASNAI